jgi:hypothetical protein
MTSEAGDTGEYPGQQAPAGRNSAFFRPRLPSPAAALGLTGPASHSDYTAANRPGSLTARSAPGENSEKARVRGEPSGAVTERARRSRWWGAAGAWAQPVPRPEPQCDQAHPLEERTRPAVVGVGGRLEPAFVAPSCGTEEGRCPETRTQHAAGAASDPARENGSDSLLQRWGPGLLTPAIRFGRPDALSVNLPILASPALLRRSLPGLPGATMAAAGGTECGTGVRGLRAVAAGPGDVQPADPVPRYAGRGREELCCGRGGGRRQRESDAAVTLGLPCRAGPGLPGRTVAELDRPGAGRQVRSAGGLGVAGSGGEHYPVSWDVAAKVGRCSLPEALLS